MLVRGAAAGLMVRRIHILLNFGDLLFRKKGEDYKMSLRNGNMDAISLSTTSAATEEMENSCRRSKRLHKSLHW